jgi:hypothetical protein
MMYSSLHTCVHTCVNTNGIHMYIELVRLN